jgi:hypothetical protein
MPVIDLADYLGMPVQAPANPVFNQTRKSTGVASLDREVDDFYKGAAAIDQLRSLQRLAPVFEAQKAQFAYDEIAQKANDLRKKQEIEAQVERAASELAGGNLNPESDDFAVKYRDLATRNPLAFSDPRFSTVAGLYENQYKGYQQAKQQRAEAEARAAQARIDAENSAYAFGVPAGRITPEMSIRDINIERGKVKTAGAGTRGGAASAEERRLSNILNVRAKEYEDAKKRVEDFDLKDTDQEFIDARNAWKEASKKYIQFNETGGVPAAPATQQQVSPSAVAASSSALPSAPTSFKDTMKGLAAPKAEDILKVNEAEILQGINDPSADENTYIAAIDSGNTSLEVKKQALAKLQQFAKSPPPRSDLTVGEAIRRRANLQTLAEQAKQEVDAYPVVQQYNKAWSGIKSTMDKTLDEFAKSISSSKDQVINSLKSGELIQGIPGYETSDVDQGGVSVYRLLSDYFADKMGQKRSFGMNRPGLSQTVEELEVFRASPFAAKIGMRGPLGLGGSKTWTDVLDVYLAEKSGSPSQSPQPVQESIVEISNEEEVDALPKGSKFRGPDGKVRIK